MLPGAELYPEGAELVPGGGKGSLTPALLEENSHPALGRHRSENNSAAGLATPVGAYKRCLACFKGIGVDYHGSECNLIRAKQRSARVQFEGL